jgi:hypothetical protein
LQLTLGHMVECIQDHVRLLDDLPNDTTLAQKIVASSVFPVTEILAIEDQLKDRRRRPEGGVNGSQSKFLEGT